MGNQVRCEVVWGAGELDNPESLSLGFWVPPPPNLVHPYQRSHRVLTDICGGHLDLDTWCRLNWGVRGDAHGFKVESLQVRGITGIYSANDPHGRLVSTTADVTLRFTTEWAAPLPVFVAMANRHLKDAASSMTALWYEEFGQTAGHLHFGFEAAPHGSETFPSATEVVNVSNYEGRAKVQSYPALTACSAIPWQPDGGYGGVRNYLTYLRDRLWPTVAGVLGPDGEQL